MLLETGALHPKAWISSRISASERESLETVHVACTRVAIEGADAEGKLTSLKMFYPGYKTSLLIMDGQTVSFTSFQWHPVLFHYYLE